MSDLELTMMRRVGELNKEVAALKAEVERLTLENSQYEEHHKYGQNVITSLREELERLTKAGDAMAAHIERNDERCYIVLPDGDIRISAWNAAKEGEDQP
jgi:uncharacterized small protein (DUF1192 family)